MPTRTISSRMVDFYPRPPRGGRLAEAAQVNITINISTHALREEGDMLTFLVFLAVLVFLPTPSARRATRVGVAVAAGGDDFYPRPPRGGRRPQSCRSHCWRNFYPRPPRGGRPGGPAGSRQSFSYFYPRPPRGGRPVSPPEIAAFPCHFYPRPPRGGRRRWPKRSNPSAYYFYPRPPRGGRQPMLANLGEMAVFLPTPSARRATIGSVYSYWI